MSRSKFICPCGFSIEGEDPVVEKLMTEHRCPEPNRSIWSYVFSGDSFPMWIGLFWVLLAIAGIVEVATDK